MARLHGEDQNAWPTEPPRKPPQAPGDYLSDDTATGNAGKDGYTVVARRPVGSEHSAGWMPPAKAREYEGVISDFPPPFDG